MPISKDLLLAILSMDSYNRGYGAGISDGGANDPDGLGETKGSSKVGNATVSYTIADAGLTDDAEAAGFYAIAYDTDYGTVISYRGTDFFPTEDLRDDARHGWSMGGGNYTALQTPLSVDFLDAVKQQAGNSNITLTGHSLGGGLAGFNSRLFDVEAVVFDPSPYLDATQNVLDYLTRDESLLDPFNPVFIFDLDGPTYIGNVISVETAREVAQEIYRPSLSQFTAEQIAAGEVTLFDKTSGYYLPGEVLDEVSGINFVRQPSDYLKIKPAGVTDSAQNISDTPRLAEGITEGITGTVY